MALVIDTQIEGPRDVHLVVHSPEPAVAESDSIVYNVSEATGNVPGKTCSTVGIVRCTYSVDNSDFNFIQLEWENGASDTLSLQLSGEGEFDFSDFGALYPDDVSSGTGDLILTTDGTPTTAGHYTIYLHLRKKYA